MGSQDRALRLQYDLIRYGIAKMSADFVGFPYPKSDQIRVIYSGLSKYPFNRVTRFNYGIEFAARVSLAAEYSLNLCL